jgi:C-terminal processing protease CtpA/Prc
MNYRGSLLAVLLAIGFPCWSHADAADLSLEARRADFETLSNAVVEDYVYLQGKETWWSTVRDRYAQRVDAASTADSWAAVVEDALGELHDFHVGVRPGSEHRWLPVPTEADLWAIPDGAGARITAVRAGSDANRAGLAVGDRIDSIGGVAVASAIDERLGPAVNAADPIARQWALLSLVTGRREESREFKVSRAGQAPCAITLPARRRVERPDGLLTSSRTPEGIGVIRFNNSLGQVETVVAFDTALASLRDTRGLILDLRDTPSGGNSTVALGILGRFVTTRLPYQRHRIPRYGKTDVERNWLEEVAPRGPFAYRGRLVVLVDHWTGSMGEGMAIGFDAMRRGTVIGTTMGQLAGAGGDLVLPRTGLAVTVPMEQLFHVNGTPRHEWAPKVIVAPVNRDTEGDPILTRARTFLKAAARTGG